MQDHDPVELRADASKLKTIINGVTQLQISEVKLQLKDDRVLLRAKDPADALLYAARMDQSFFEEYNRGDFSEVGVEVDPLLSTLEKMDGSTKITYAAGEDSLNRVAIKGRNDVVRFGGIDPEYVQSGIEAVPDLDFPVVGTLDSSVMDDFTGKASGIIGSTDCIIRHRGEGLDFYSEKDGNDVYRRAESPKFELKQFVKEHRATLLDHQRGMDADDVSESVFGMDFISGIPFESDGVEISLGNDQPIRFVYEMYDGVSVSWIVTPRIPGASDRRSIPEGIY